VEAVDILNISFKNFSLELTFMLGIKGSYNSLKLYYQDMGSESLAIDDVEIEINDDKTGSYLFTKDRLFYSTTYQFYIETIGFNSSSRSNRYNSTTGTYSNSESLILWLIIPDFPLCPF
jgi:hypothetical protein